MRPDRTASYFCLAPLLSLVAASCDGPHERAGERADMADGVTDTTASLRAGPAEKAGERMDQAEREREDRR